MAMIRVKSGCPEPRTPEEARLARPGPRPHGLAKELVVARYREDVAWLDEVPDGFYVNLLDKGAEPIQCSRQLRRVSLPNIGREAHSIAWWCSTYYDTLADWTYFLQGDATYHTPDIVGRLGVDYTEVCSLTETYSPGHPAASVHESDRVEEVGGYRVAYGNCRAQPGKFYKAGLWGHVFSCPEPDPWWFGYTASFAVPKSAIQARPRDFWRWLLEEIARAPSVRDEPTSPPLNPWALESLWWYLFSSPSQYPHKEPARVRRCCGGGVSEAQHQALLDRKRAVEESVAKLKQRRRSR
jgi:hypothetical protein